MLPAYPGFEPAAMAFSVSRVAGEEVRPVERPALLGEQALAGLAGEVPHVGENGLEATPVGDPLVVGGGVVADSSRDTLATRAPLRASSPMPDRSHRPASRSTTTARATRQPGTSTTARATRQPGTSTPGQLGLTLVDLVRRPDRAQKMSAGAEARRQPASRRDRAPREPGTVERHKHRLHPPHATI
jgi:hypothetical protein